MICELQELKDPKALLANLHLLFGLHQSSQQKTSSYISSVFNLVSRCKDDDHDFTDALVSFNTMNGLYLTQYQKVLDSFEVKTLDWSMRSLQDIKYQLSLKEHHTSLTGNSSIAAAFTARTSPPHPRSHTIASAPALASPDTQTPNPFTVKYSPVDVLKRISTLPGSCPLYRYSSHSIVKVCCPSLESRLMTTKDSTLNETQLTVLNAHWHMNRCNAKALDV